MRGRAPVSAAGAPRRTGPGDRGEAVEAEVRRYRGPYRSARLRNASRPAPIASQAQSTPKT